jgi:hypothetical protein
MVPAPACEKNVTDPDGRDQQSRNPENLDRAYTMATL